jgi:ABC-type transport system involved in cytochrome c biogenesis permease subunit
VLQVVRNTGWMIPYVSCAMVGIGLVLHFLGTFLRFVERLAAGRSSAGRYGGISLAFVAGFVLLFALFAWRSVPQPARYQEMNLDRFGQIPVAFGGRVQPLDSIARSTLRQLRKYEIPVKWDWQQEKEVKYQPVRWLADWVFGSEGSEDYRIFRIDDPDIVQGLSLIRRKSHLYSMQELDAVGDELDRLVADARTVSERDEADLSLFQKKILKLSGNIERVRLLRYAFSLPVVFEGDDPVRTLELLIGADSSPNRIPMAVPGDREDDWSVLSPQLADQWIESLCERFGTRRVDELARRMVEVKSVDQFREILTRRELGRSLVQLAEMDPRQVDEDRLQQTVDDLLGNSDPQIQARVDSLKRLIQPQVDSLVEMQVASMSEQVAAELERFASVSDGQFDFTGGSKDLPLGQLHVSYKAGAAADFNAAVDQHLQRIADKPDVLANHGKVQTEHWLNRLSPFYLATAIYIGGFVLSLLSWLFLTGSASSPALSSLATAARRASFWVIVLGFLLHTAGLLMRIYISGRPPVTNLYGSAVFIGWVGVLFGLVTERMIGYCFGNVMASFAGVTTLLTAFALGAEGDTFSVLQAVLDTQFWLSTHVVSITIGYAATLVAGLLGILYLLTSMAIPRDLTSIRKTMAKMVYGVTCLALIFSFVGTVLGGLWADDSWGRFWGWDPKENGALMIVLVNAILLHARWAGMIRDRGMAVVAIVGNIVTLWSWFAVNELGIGLHTYGLTEGRMRTLSEAWLAHFALIVVAAIPTRYWLGNRAANRVAAAAAVPDRAGRKSKTN